VHSIKREGGSEAAPGHVMDQMATCVDVAHADHPRVSRQWQVIFSQALGRLWGAYRLAINTLCGGFDVAFMWPWVAFCFLPSVSGH